MTTILMSSGEASGDRMAAMVLRALGGSVRAFGMGGQASVAAGLREVASRDIHGLMGVVGVATRWRAVLRSFRDLTGWARAVRPAAAVLFGFTTFHELAGKVLRRQGTPVLWCAAPQVWAWRESRLRTMRDSVDRLAVILPFEQPLWAAHGYDVRYVGHPAMDQCAWGGGRVRRLAVLCGSREHEARSLGPLLTDAAARWVALRPDWSADMLLAPSLRPATKAWLRQMALQSGLAVVETPTPSGAAGLVETYEAALCASGTASLEAAISGVPPVVVYRTNRPLRLAARLMLRTRDIALPNVLLGRRAFPEITADHPAPADVMQALDAVMDNRARHLAACAETRRILQLQDGSTFGDRVGRMVAELVRGRGAG